MSEDLKLSMPLTAAEEGAGEGASGGEVRRRRVPSNGSGGGRGNPEPSAKTTASGR